MLRGGKGGPVDLRRLKDSFGFAFKGLAAGFKGQQNIRIHLVVALLVLAAAAALRLDTLRTAVLVLAIGLVLAVEFVNTAVERALDRLHPKRDPEVGRIKDVMAGAVLLAAAAAVAAGILVFFDPAAALLKRFFP